VTPAATANRQRHGHRHAQGGRRRADGRSRWSPDMTVHRASRAGFGRGVMADVSDKIVGQFSSCLANKLGPGANAGRRGRRGRRQVGHHRDLRRGGHPGQRGGGHPSARRPRSARRAWPRPPRRRPPRPARTAPHRSWPAAPEPTRSEVDAIDLLDTRGRPGAQAAGAGRARPARAVHHLPGDQGRKS